MDEFVFEISEDGPVVLGLCASVDDWRRLFHVVQERVAESSEPERARVRVRVPGWKGSPEPAAESLVPAEALLSPESSAPAHPVSARPDKVRDEAAPDRPVSPDKVKDGAGNHSLSSKALRLRQLVAQTPGLARGKAMQKLALRAADFDEVLRELGAAVVCVACASARGRPSRRLWIRDPAVSASQLKLQIEDQVCRDRGLPKNLRALLPATVERQVSEAFWQGLEVKVFDTPGGRVLMVEDTVVWREALEPGLESSLEEETDVR